MKSKVIFFVIVLLNFGCKSKTDQKDQPAGINQENTFFTLDLPELMKKKQEVSLSEIADTIEYIPLETSQNSLLGSISDAKFTKDYIFIGQGLRRPIVQFDRAGNFIRNIGNMGRGPEEYVVMRDFSIDEEKRVIYILSSFNGSIQAYSFDGEYIKAIRFPQSYGEIVWIRDSSFMCFQEPLSGTGKYVFEERNSKNEIIQTVKNHFFWQHTSKYTFGTSYPQRKVFYRLNNKLHFKGWYNDTVFTFNDKNEITPKFFIDLKNLKLPNEMRIEVTGAVVTSPEYYWVSVKESSRYIFILYSTYSSSEGRPSYYGFIYFDKNKMDGSRYMNKMGKVHFVNDLDGGPNFNPEYVNDSLAFSFESPSQLKKYLETDNSQNTDARKQELKEVLKLKLKGLNVIDNPVIMIVKLKF